ncbi:uncharacterized protein LOC124168034 isoform X4 [Ischnura elegans]|uniref:uncharacterized protein LOC124168034 isoform X4 n=1 Tax=Ischnura elegans TaxID=197161 RepID=UPI001ED881BC|nr:uncharacterized protein LOC124168034 isoform X4 [Ischnura elegans]XP_046402085.1 uncharacterized protein LOC124168034 isoform X4 [Ischnura elegans]
MCIAGSDGDDRRQDPVSASPLGTPPCFAASLPGPGVEAGATAGGDGRCRRRLRRVLPPKAKTPPAGRMKRIKCPTTSPLRPSQLNYFVFRRGWRRCKEELDYPVRVFKMLTSGGLVVFILFQRKSRRQKCHLPTSQRSIWNAGEQGRRLIKNIGGAHIGGLAPERG